MIQLEVGRGCRSTPLDQVGGESTGMGARFGAGFVYYRVQETVMTRQRWVNIIAIVIAVAGVIVIWYAYAHG